MDEKKEEVKSSEIKQSNKALVFISHDTRDAELAEAFSKLLSSVSAGVLKSFRSSDKKGNQGIAYGVEWYPEIMKKLNDASDVVALLTKHSVDRPWILYEAGVAKGKLDTPLLGIALGIPLNKANNGPFAQFQNSSDDTDSLTKLVVQLVKRIPNAEPDKDVIKTQVEAFKKNADAILAKEPELVHSDGELLEDASVAKLFEEIKIMFQDLPSRIDNNIRYDYRERKRRFHPMMIDELCHMTKNPVVGITIALGIFKETSFPWIYDLGMDLVNILKSKKTKAEKERAFHEFEEIIELTSHHPIMREFGFSSKEDHMIVREMPRILLKNMHNIFLER